MPTINPLAALSNLGEATQSRSTIANNFDTFLTLLTTQLQNQNPLEPLDTNQFTQQLVQFSEVEQTIRSNENLENLLKLQAATAVTNSVAYIGKKVELSSSTQNLANGEASWPITSDGTSTAAQFIVKNKEGSVVFSQTQPLNEGQSHFTWNGQTADGTPAPQGQYTLSVTATDQNGTAINVKVANSGLVEGVDMSGDSLVLLVNGNHVNLEDVTSIRQ